MLWYTVCLHTFAVARNGRHLQAYDGDMQVVKMCKEFAVRVRNGGAGAEPPPAKVLRIAQSS